MTDTEMFLIPGAKLVGSSVQEEMSTGIRLLLQYIWAVPVPCTARPDLGEKLHSAEMLWS